MKASSLDQTSCLAAADFALADLAAVIYQRTCRIDFEQPGFCVIRLGAEFGSFALRRFMVDLKSELTTIHERTAGNTLGYLSVARFDQQTTTKLHRDGGPDECLLMLGYEPTAVVAELSVADYSRCAFELGLSPAEFLANHNPMFQANSAMLHPYTTPIGCFSPNEFQIVCINNSRAGYTREKPRWQGLLHAATILTPDESQRRVINSTLIAPVAQGIREAVTADQIAEFLTTTAVRRQGYDKQHLADDA